jgi:hypothetical protein
MGRRIARSHAQFSTELLAGNLPLHPERGPRERKNKKLEDQSQLLSLLFRISLLKDYP